MRFVSIGLALGAFVLCGPVVAGQAAPVPVAGRFSATRAELESMAARAESAAATAAAQIRDEKQREATAVRARLRDGDFDVGDRVALFLRGDTVLSDTFVVEAGRTLALPSIPTVSLVGVLRSELQPHLLKEFADFVKDTTLRAKALIQFGVVGEVARPGYYLLPMDVPISEAIMAAGGLTTRTDLLKTYVRRRSRELLSKAAVRDAMVEQLTLEELNLAPGDELVVGAKREWGWQTVASLATGAIALLLSVGSR